MVPVIDAIAAAANATAIRKPNRQKAKPSERQIFRVPNLPSALHQLPASKIGTAEKLPFNIGRIPVRQSRGGAFCAGQTANLAAGQKRGGLDYPRDPATGKSNH
jgi:hypothetical protein